MADVTPTAHDPDTVTVPWREWTDAGRVVVAVCWAALIMFVMSKLADQGAPWLPAPWKLRLGSVAVAALLFGVLSWFPIARAINHTLVQIGLGTVSVRHGPVPGWSGASLDRDTIHAIVVREKKHHRLGHTMRLEVTLSYSILARLFDGHHVVLVPEVGGADEVDAHAAQLAARLDLPPPVPARRVEGDLEVR